MIEDSKLIMAILHFQENPENGGLVARKKLLLSVMMKAESLSSAP